MFKRLKQKIRNKIFTAWSAEMRNSHPCPTCLQRPTWHGRLCDTCQTEMSIWCPCATVADYEKAKLKNRKPLPDYIVPEICNRCGLRIRVLCECQDDEVFEHLIDGMLN